MTNQYMNNLYRDLLSNSPLTITIDISSRHGDRAVLQVVTKQGASCFGLENELFFRYERAGSE